MTGLMKNWVRGLAACATTVWAALAYAQTQVGEVTEKTSTTTTTAWYGQWWMWAVGVAVFLVVIIALTNRPSSRA